MSLLYLRLYGLRCIIFKNHLASNRVVVCSRDAYLNILNYMRALLSVGKVITRSLISVRAPTRNPKLASCLVGLSTVSSVRAFAIKAKMSDSESENFDVDNVSDGSESDGYVVPTKKASGNQPTRFYPLSQFAYASHILRKRLLPPQNPK